MNRQRYWLVLSCVLFVSTGFAAIAGKRDRAREEPIEAELQRIAPKLVPTFVSATMAMDTGNYADAEKLFGEVTGGAPAFDPAMRRLGTCLAQLGRQAEGLEWVERAVKTNRSAANLISLAQVLAFQKDATASKAQLFKALGLIRECHGKPNGGDDLDVWAMEAQLDLQLDELIGARHAVTEMNARFPDAMVTHYYTAIIAAVAEEWSKAADEIDEAERKGLDHATAQRFLESGVRTHAITGRIVRISIWVLVSWVFGLTALFGLGYGLSRVTLRQIERADPGVGINAGERRLRRLYRSIINLAGIYYYISLPVVAVLVVGLAAGFVYGCLLAGRIPVQLVVIIVIGAITTVWAMGRSLFLKVDMSDPGRALRRDEAPGLWQSVEDVARQLQTSPVDEIRVTVGTDLCVYERGNWREKLRGHAPRVLVIGVAVLDGFKQENFRSVLAHEYGHFANRDTAGGDIAMRVRTDMMKFYRAMIRARQATKLNAAFHFLRFYNFIFRRISHGATRLQEVLADRVAAQAFGAQAFEGGLTHVIRESILFNARAESEVGAVRKEKRLMRNLYDRTVAVPSLIAEKDLAEALNRPTTEDDTHPGPQDRFQLVKKVPARTCPPLPGDVWDLFADKDALVKEMMETVQKNVAHHYE